MAANKIPTVSVVLPFYHAPSLKNAVLSILNQSYKDFELILVDNANNERYREEAIAIARLDKRIHLIEEPQQGVVFAANTGIKAARGEFIMRMDADDESFPNRMELQLETLINNPSIGVVSGKIEYVGAMENKGFITYVEWLNGICHPDEIALNQFVEFPMANPSMMFRKSLFEQYGYYRDGDFPEDYEFFLRLMQAGVSMTKVSANVLKWVDSEQRLTRTDPRYHQNYFHQLKAQYLTDWLKKHNPYHPNVLVWGAGRLSRRRSDFLSKNGVSITQYIDIKKASGVMHYQDIPPPGQCFIVSYVSNRGVRDQIKSFLIERNYREGIDFILAA